MDPSLLIALIFSLFFGAGMYLGPDDDEAADDTGDPGPDDGDPVDPPVGDIGASFERSDTGVTLTAGADETGRFAVIYYFDEEEGEDDFVVVYEARFYLVPEGTDWSGVNWENRGDIPGSTEETLFTYDLADFEAANGLQLLGTVNLEQPGTPEEIIGEITSNRPIDGWLLEATFDGDELIYFLPEDYVVTRNGVELTEVSEDTAGTGGYDWLRAVAPGITISGRGGDDDLEAGPQANGSVLQGGAGNDNFDTEGASSLLLDGGAGSDDLNIRGGTDHTVLGGAGDDSIGMSGSGTIYGGDGADNIVVYGNPATVYGGAGDDRLVASNPQVSVLYGGDGADFIYAAVGTTGFGDAGNDTLQLDTDSTGFGGDGDDRFNVWNFHDEAGATATGGAGADTYNVLVFNAANGEGPDAFLTVTDFVPGEDLLEIGNWNPNAPATGLQIIEDDAGGFTEIRVTFPPAGNQPDPGIAVIRLEGATGVTTNDIVLNP